MILEAPLLFVNYVSNSREFLNCPNVIFNEHLNATYRQFHGNNEAYHIAILLYTFGYNKSKAQEVAKQLVEFYSTTSHQDFMQMNVSSYSQTPQWAIAKNDRISEFIEKGTKYYKFTNIASYTPSYPFLKGYRLKQF